MGYHLNGTLTTNDATETSIEEIDLVDGTSLHLDVVVVANKTGERAVYERRALVYRDGGVATATAITGPTGLSEHQDEDGGGASAWRVKIDTDGANKARVRVTGDVGDTIDWDSDTLVRPVG